MNKTDNVSFIIVVVDWIKNLKEEIIGFCFICYKLLKYSFEIFKITFRFEILYKAVLCFYF